jgi:CheY-like chemotaxis protein
MLPLVIVDDSRNDAILASTVLQQAKILNPIHILTSGEECIKFIKGEGEHAHRTLPCLFLLDLLMGPTGGIDVLRYLSKSADYAKGSMVVMLSGLSDLKLVQKGYQLGAATFLVKPLQIDDVMRLASSVRGLSATRVASGNILTLDPNGQPRPSDGLLSVAL